MYSWSKIEILLDIDNIIYQMSLIKKEYKRLLQNKDTKIDGFISEISDRLKKFEAYIENK